MEKANHDILHFSTLEQYVAALGQESHNPLIEVIDFGNNRKTLTSNRIVCDFYMVFLKDVKCGDMIYGRQTYDYQAGTLVFIAPGQLYGFRRPDPNIKSRGKGLLFHPDLLRGTSLAKGIKEYNYFSYEVNEALHLSDHERQTVLECLANISDETDSPIEDRHSRRLIVSNLELLLNYCLRFYDRQFSTRSKENADILTRFESLLDDYISSGRARREGQPSVKSCAALLHISPNYFGDLIKRETGRSASEHIHSFLINMAKDRIFNPTTSISEIAYDMGFQYPQHFSRLFKKATGLSPKEYREQAHI